MVRKSQYRHLLKILKSGFNRINIEQDMAIQKLNNCRLEIHGYDCRAPGVYY